MMFGVFERSDDLKEALMEALEREIRSGNTRVLLWLAEKLRLLEADPDQRGADINAILSNLSSDDLEEYRSLAQE